MRKLVGSIPILQCGASLIAENEKGKTTQIFNENNLPKNIYLTNRQVLLEHVNI